MPSILQSCFILSQTSRASHDGDKRQGIYYFSFSSIHSHIIRGMPSYSTAKAALDMLSKELAHRFGRSYIESIQSRLQYR